jgi:hypothetical protein
MRFLFFIFLLSISLNQTIAQNNDENEILDSIYIIEIQDQKNPDKVLHAEPLFIDLIRDLGARKGEKEWNLGFGLTDKNNYDDFLTLVEYEWAPINRLGFEVELPFSFYQKNATGDKPENRLNSIKLATQYSFFVSEKLKTSLAFGYIHEFELNSFNNYGNKNIYVGNIYNPFFIAAKRWGNNFHTLLYTGPRFNHHFDSKELYFDWQMNSNFHYMISGTRNFIGIEFNKVINKDDFDMTIRPQMRLQITDNLMLGIVTGFPINREKERFSTFFRLIYEPKH